MRLFGWVGEVPAEMWLAHNMEARLATGLLCVSHSTMLSSRELLVNFKSTGIHFHLNDFLIMILMSF